MVAGATRSSEEVDAIHRHFRGSWSGPVIIPHLGREFGRMGGSRYDAVHIRVRLLVRRKRQK
jgi:hypothetical protein